MIFTRIRTFGLFGFYVECISRYIVSFDKYICAYKTRIIPISKVQTIIGTIVLWILIILYRIYNCTMGINIVLWILI